MSTPPTTLKEWRQLAWQLQADLQELEGLARTLGRADTAERAGELRARVAAHGFTIAVVGDFKRGKSTFINALLGRDILPSDIAPTTATVNRITYGLRPEVELRLHSGERRLIPVESLGEWVTKLSEAAEAAAATVREAIVRYPVRFCRNDVDILDTPGLGDEATMSAITMRLLPDVDAAILVVMADSPLSETEGGFIERLWEAGVTDVLYVVSAMDRIRRPEDRARVVESIRGRIAARARAVAETRWPQECAERSAFLARHGEPQLFPVSALDALDAQGTGDPEALAASGMPAFEVGLERFLTATDRVGLRRRLEQVAQIAAELLRDWPSSSVTAEPEALRAELARLDALCAALESAIEAHRRTLVEGQGASLQGLEEILKKWPGMARTAIHATVTRHPIGEDWTKNYLPFTDTVGAGTEAAVAKAALALGAQVEQHLAQKRTAEDTAPLTAATAYVLGWVGRRLARLGHPTGLDLGPPPEPVGLGFDPTAFSRAITPPAEIFTAILRDEVIVNTLDRYHRKTGLDRLLAFDFTGLQGQWSSLATPRLDAMAQRHQKDHPVTAAVQAQLEADGRRAFGQIEPASTAVRKARSELVACRERERLRREHEAAEQAAGRARLDGIRARAQAAISAL